jgi:hypothetical protein
MENLKSNNISRGLLIWYRILLLILGALLTTFGVLFVPHAVDIPLWGVFEWLANLFWLGLTLIAGPIIIFIGLFTKNSTVKRIVNRIFMKKSDFK